MADAVKIIKGNDEYKFVVECRPDLIEGCRLELPDHTTHEQAIAVARALYPNSPIDVVERI
jgi:hypothetical protein